MNKIKRGIKRFIAGILSVITCISVFIISPGSSLIAHAEPDSESTSAGYSAEGAKATAGAMMQNFANGGEAELKIGDITESEFRAWGVLLSNFYVPFQTIINKVGEEDDGTLLTNLNTQKEENYNVWNTFKKVWKINSNNDDTELLQDLLTRYHSCTQTGMKRLYFGGIERSSKSDDLSEYYTFTNAPSGDSGVARLACLMSNNFIEYGGWYLYWVDDESPDKKHVVFANPLDSESSYAIKALLMCIKMMDVKHLSYITSTEGSTDTKNIASELFVSPFGDICCNYNNDPTFNNVTVIIPACLNPFTFDNIYGDLSDEEKIDGYAKKIKLYLNNIFGLSNFLQNTDITKSVADFFEAGNSVTDIKLKSDINKKNYFDVGEGETGSTKLAKYLKFGSMVTVPSIQVSASNKAYVSSQIPILDSSVNADTLGKAVKAQTVQKDGIASAFNTAKNNGIPVGLLKVPMPVSGKTLLDTDIGLKYLLGSGFKIYSQESISVGNDTSHETPEEWVEKCGKKYGINLDISNKKITYYIEKSDVVVKFTGDQTAFKNVFYDKDTGKLKPTISEELKNKLGLPDTVSKVEVNEVEAPKVYKTLYEKPGFDKYIQQSCWSIFVQRQLSDSNKTYSILGKNSFAVVGRSSSFDIDKNGKYKDKKLVSIGTTVKSNLFKEYGFYGTKSTKINTRFDALGVPNYDYRDSDNNNTGDSNIIEAYTSSNFRGKPLIYNTGSTMRANQAFNSQDRIYYSGDAKDISDDETKFLSIYLGSLSSDDTWRKEEQKSQALIDDYLITIGYLKIIKTGQHKDEMKYDDEALDRKICFELPLDNVECKLGLFNTGYNISVASSGSDSKFKDSNNFDIDILNIFSEFDEEKTVLNKIHAPKEEKDGIIYLPESLYTLCSTIEIRNKNSYALEGPGYVAWYFSMDRNLFANIYWAYIEDIVGITAENLLKSLNSGDEVYVLDKDFSHLPPISNEGMKKGLGLIFSESKDTEEAVRNAELEEKQWAIIDWTYKILSIGDTINNIGDIVAEKATAAGQYVIGWLKGMIDSLFIGWNNYMLGVDVSAGVTGSVSNVGNATKSKAYSTAMGYMTTPTFSNLPITSWIMSNFQLIYVIIMIVVVVILIMMVLTRARRLPQAILIFLCMAFIIVLPANMLNGAIGVSNNFTENIYSDKFQYWAISQHAEYLKGVSYSQNQTSANLYDNLNRQNESSAGGVTLKWMAPKKWGIAEQIKAAAKNTDGLKLFLRFAGDRIDAEDFSDYTPGDTYLYRPYYGIYVEAYNLWHAIEGQDKTANIKLTDLGKSINNLWFGGNRSKEYKVNTDMKNNNSIADAQNIKSGVVRNSNFFRYVSVRGDSIMRSAVGGTGFGNSKNGIMTYQTPYFDSYYKDSQVIKDIQPQFKDQSRIYAMYSDINLISALFNFNINNTLFTDSNNPCGLWLYKAGKDSSNTVNSNGTSSNSYTTGIKAYFDYSESPYYYFYNALADLKVKTDNGSYVYGDTDFVDLILKNETFKVTNQQSKAYGELKDYLDLEGLFSYVIPLLNQGNQNAQQYFGKYGQTVDRNDSKFSDSTEIVVSDESKNEVSDEKSKADISTGKIVKVNEATNAVTELKIGDELELKQNKIGKGKNFYTIKYKKNTEENWIEFLKDAEAVENIIFEESGDYTVKFVIKDEVDNIKEYKYSIRVKEQEKTDDSSEQQSTKVERIKTVGENLYNKYDQQLQAIWNMYSPWVAQMIAANNKAEKVRSGFGYVELLEPWNPADYRYFGRDMAFSPADARVHGYQSYDLSNVETKMHKVLEDTYYDILDLVNYKDYTMVSSEYGSHVLISAAAMCATFNFNREFSDNGFMSTDVTLYPQSYELKNMNFDAYLRIILGNSMGMNPVTMKNSDYSGSLTIYEEFIHNTSVWSGLVLVAEDFLAIFVVPLLKIMLIVVIFVLALALAISCIINKPDKMIRVFLSTFIAPLVGMTAIFMAHSLVISWFIGDGIGTNVIDTHSISVTTGDPTLTLLLMIVVDLVTSILMWKLLKFSAKSTAKYIQDIGSGIASLGKGTFSGLAQIITAAAGVGTLALGTANAIGGVAKTAVGGAVGAGKAISHKKEVHQERKLDKERNKLLKEGNRSGTGTGTGKSKTGTGGSGTGTGTGTSKPTGALGTGSKYTESMASDIKAIRQKLEKGFNPNGMSSTDSTATGTGAVNKKKVNSKGNNASSGAKAKKQQEEFNKRRAGVMVEKLRSGSVEDRKKYALQTRAMNDRFEKLKNDNNAVFDSKSGKWTSDGSATTTAKINRLYTDVNKRKSAMYQATTPVEPSIPAKPSPINVGTHGVRTGKHAGGSKRKRSKKNRKAKKK